MFKKVLLIGALLGIGFSTLSVYHGFSFFDILPDTSVSKNLALTTGVSPTRVSTVKVANCTCPPGLPKVFAIGGQGSTEEIDSSKFAKYVQANYAGKADIQNEGIVSTGINAPTEATLDKIATHISSYIINVGGPVKIWSYSLGALYTPYIVELVKAKLKAAGVTCYNLDMILIDPPFKDGWTIPSCAASVLGVCNVKVFDFINKWSDRIRTNPGLINLSGGAVLTNPQGSIIPNADKHYPFGLTSADAKWALGQIKNSLDSSLQNMCIGVKVLRSDTAPAYAGSASYTKSNPGVSAYAVSIKNFNNPNATALSVNTDKNGQVVFINLKANEKYQIDVPIYDHDTKDTAPVPLEVSPTLGNNNYTVRLGPRLSTGWYPANELRAITSSLYKAFKPTTFQPSLERDSFLSCTTYQGRPCNFAAPQYSSEYPYQISTPNKDLEYAARACLDGLGYLATTACVNNKMVQVERTENLPAVKVATTITPSTTCLAPELKAGNIMSFTVRAPQLGPNNPSDGLENYKDYDYAVTLYVDGKVAVPKQAWKEPRGAVSFNFGQFMDKSATTHDIYAVIAVHTSSSYNKTNSVFASESNHVKIPVGLGACNVGVVTAYSNADGHVCSNQPIVYDVNNPKIGEWRTLGNFSARNCFYKSVTVTNANLITPLGLVIQPGIITSSGILQSRQVIPAKNGTYNLTESGVGAVMLKK